jgi:hypothetical protein
VSGALMAGRIGRRDAFGLLAAAVAVLGVSGAATAAPVARVEVWQDPSCGCCEGWVRHMRASGFEVTVREVADVRPVKAARGVPEAFQSCHTAVVDGYVVEGHVPAADVRRNRPLARTPTDPARRTRRIVEY